MQVTHKDYLDCLQPWVKASEKYCYRAPERSELECYGYGDSGHWSVQTNLKAFAAYAVLAADPSLDESKVGMSREALLQKALRVLRYALETHFEGSYHCIDGKKWGFTWISALGLERAMHGVEAIWDFLSEKDHELLQKVLVAESNWLLDEYEVKAGLVEDNRPESNLWNGALLHRTAAMYPDTPRAAQYREKGTAFLINSISVPSDATLEIVVDGRPVSEWHVGANFFESYACNHHRYMNVGYMMICLSNAAMLHFFFKERGIEPPSALYHHVADLWSVLKHFIFPDGRLLRIGGDSRARYCYCQDYIIPSLLMIMDYLGDGSCISFESGWLSQVKHEIEANGDGTFLSTRCRSLEEISPVYYARLESDRAASISMGAYWRRLFNVVSDGPTQEKGKVAWEDEFHGASFHRSEKRIASWVWAAGAGPNGLCVPENGSDLAEWRQNLISEIYGLNEEGTKQVRRFEQKSFDGGFITWGSVDVASGRMLAEGQEGEKLARQQVVFTALPDDRSVVTLQYADTDRRVYITSIKGLFLQIPNDVFNDNTRTYYSEAGVYCLSKNKNDREVLPLHSQWINIEDKLGVIGIYGGEMSIFRQERFKVGQKFNLKVLRMLAVDEICYPYFSGVTLVEKGSVLLDIGVLLHTGSSEETRICSETGNCIALELPNPCVRAVVIRGYDGIKYLVIANFGNERQVVELGLQYEGYNLVTEESVIPDSEKGIALELDANSPGIYRLSE